MMITNITDFMLVFLAKNLALLVRGVIGRNPCQLFIFNGVFYRR